MGNKRKYLIAGLIVIMLFGAVAAVRYMNEKYQVVEDISLIKAEAEALYSMGNTDDAIFKLQSYCSHVVTDIDAKIMLGDWYMESGDENRAYTAYYDAAKSKKYQEERFTSLSVKNNREVMDEPITEVVLEITPDVRCTKDMTLMITGHNLVPDERVAGRISEMEYNLVEEENYYTTSWFDVDPDGDYLTVSGGFNCAIWQFMDEYGEILTHAKSSNNYREKDTYSVNVYQMARVIIPDKAVKCRVTYLDLSKNDYTAAMDETLTIVYGRLPGESKEADFSFYEIPDIKEGEKIVYKNNQWSMITEEGETILDNWKLPSIEKGSHFAVGGTLPGKVSLENSVYASYEKSGIYTIQFDINNPSATGKRLDDAKNLGFNASVGEKFFTAGENHFDNIYPWSEMKLCTVRDGKITYVGEGGFSSTGNYGDVFVEIPRFYFKRTVDEAYDTISISGEKHEGFELDEAFVTENGEVDKIYIAAYLTGENENGINSGADFSPVLSLSANELLRKISDKGAEYHEIDYAALSAIQKLFMVETGIRNSQYFFMGICAYSLPSDDYEGVAVALTDRTKTNCVEVVDSYTFIEGNNIVIFDITDYENSIKKAVLDIKQITAVVNNFDGTQAVFFSGDPITVEKGKIAIAHVATQNGTTGSISGHTGAVGTERGTVAFKYRHIENLWGNTYVYIDNVRVNGNMVTITDRRGKTHTLSYSLPDEKAVLESMIKKIGYDPLMPGVMLPTEIGEGATISTYYGDAYLNYAADRGGNALYYGGAWNSAATAGLFSYMVDDGDERMNASGRLMYIPK